MHTGIEVFLGFLFGCLGVLAMQVVILYTYFTIPGPVPKRYSKCKFCLVVFGLILVGGVLGILIMNVDRLALAFSSGVAVCWIIKKMTHENE